MPMIVYRVLSAEDISPDILDGFDRRQEVKLCRKKVGDGFTLVANPFVDDWNREQRDFVVWAMGNILSNGGWIAGAFAGDCLKGVIALEAAPLGSRGQYREVCGFWVSRESRGQGIGRRLFSMAKEACRKLGGEKLYISSHPAAETQAFYKAMGCVEAQEYSQPHVEREPWDCQIECSI